MIVLGLILVLVGWFTKITLLYYLGGLLLIVGVVLVLVGGSRPVAGRRHWF